jgi:hypothetical protein
VDEEDSGEKRKVTIVWEVEDKTEKGLDSVARHQQEALRGLATGASAQATNAKATADLAKMGRVAEQTAAPIKSISVEIASAANGAKNFAAQAQSVIGKLSGMAGAAGLVITAVTGIAMATYEWATAQEDVEAAANKRAYTMAILDAQQLVRMEKIDKSLEKEAQLRQGIADIRADKENDNATALDREAEKQAALGANISHVNDLRIQSLEIKKSQAIYDADEYARLQHQIDLLQIESGLSNAPKRASAGGSGPSEADRVRAMGEGRLQQMADEIAMSQALAEITGRDVDLITERRDLRLAELELERQVLEVTRASNSVERQGIDNRMAAIDRNADLVNIQARIDARRVENAERDKAGETAIARLQAEGQATARVIDLESARAAKATAMAQIELGAAGRVADLTGRRQDLLAVESAGARVHALTIAQLGQEAAATQQALDLREAEARAREGAIPGIQHKAEIEQIAHERKLAMIDAELAAMQAADAEKATLAANEQARIQQYTSKLSEAIGTFENIQGSFQSVITDVTSRARDEQDADLESWKANLEARTQSQSAAYDRQIENARGNAGLRRDLERKKAALEKSTQKKIEAAESAHNEKRKRNEMRFQGIMLLVQAAVQTAKAAAAYPVVPSMIAHGIAATINTGYGIALLAGKVPGAGGGSVGGGGGSSGTAPSQSDRGSKEVNRVPESVGGRAAERQGGRGRTIGGASGNVTFAGNVTINALGSIDEDAAVKIGMAVNTGKHIREGSAIK